VKIAPLKVNLNTFVLEIGWVVYNFKVRRNTASVMEKFDRMILLTKLTLAIWVIWLLSSFETLFLNLTPEKYDHLPLIVWLISFVGVIITSIIFLRENKKYQSEFAETCSIEGCENKANIPSNKELCTKHDETHKTNLRRSRLSVIPLIIFMIYWFFFRF